MEKNMLNVFILCYLLILTCGIIKANDEENVVKNEFNKTLAGSLTRDVWKSYTVTPFEYTLITPPDYPDPYTRGVYEWSVKSSKESYGIEIIIKFLEISGDFLQIKAGEKSTPNSEALVFEYYLNEERKYRIPTNEIYMKLQAYTNLLNTGFEIKARSIGVKEITTQAPPTTPAPNVIYPYENSMIYLWGREHHDFVANVSEEFRYNLAAIADLFCDEKNITVDPNITIYDNVDYHVIGPCNLNWVNNELCTFINYSISINYDNETNNYELTAAHLDEMWQKYNVNMNLSKYDLEIYYPPNDSHIIFVWVMIFASITLMFSMFLFIVYRYSNWFTNIFRPVLDDDIEDTRRKTSNRDLMFPTEYEDLPPFFSNAPPEFEKNYLDNFEVNDNLGYERNNFDPNEDFIESILENPHEHKFSNADYNLEESNL